MTYFTFFLAIGMALFIFFLMAKNIYRFYFATNYWSETKGVITKVSVEVSDHSTGEYRAPGSTAHGGFILKPTYEYWVGSEKFTNDAYQAGAASSFASEEEAMALYSEGQEVSVYYSVDDPAKSVLSKEQKASSFIAFGIFAFALLGVAFITGRKLF